MLPNNNLDSLLDFSSSKPKLNTIQIQKPQEKFYSTYNLQNCQITQKDSQNSQKDPVIKKTMEKLNKIKKKEKEKEILLKKIEQLKKKKNQKEKMGKNFKALQMIRNLTGYSKNKFRELEKEDIQVGNLDMYYKEEEITEKIGRMEDEEEIKYMKKEDFME